MQLILATRNAHKTREIQRILGPDFTVRDLTTCPEIYEIAETGTSFKGNAVLKAVAASKELPGLIVADDSGLEVNALDGAPGIYSARYAGAVATDQENIDKLLAALKRAKADQERTAIFRCVLALAKQGQLIDTFEGSVKGTIVESPRGAAGFGYDPIFLPNGFDKTFGEVAADQKDCISHRARALAKLRTWLLARTTRR